MLHALDQSTIIDPAIQKKKQKQDFFVCIFWLHNDFISNSNDQGLNFSRMNQRKE